MKILKLNNYDLNFQNNKGNTVLHYACANGSTLSVLSMIKEGAKLDIKNNDKNTPFALALLNNNTQLCICLLQECDANQFTYSKGSFPKVKNWLSKEEYVNTYETKLKHDVKHNVFWHAMKLNDDGIMYMVLLKGFPYYKAIKTAIKNNKLLLANIHGPQRVKKKWKKWTN